MSELSAKVSKHFQSNVVMPLSESNLSKHTQQSPSSREAKLRHILVYVDLQRELITLEDQHSHRTATTTDKQPTATNLSYQLLPPSPSSAQSPSPSPNTISSRRSPLSPTTPSSITKGDQSDFAAGLHNDHLHLQTITKTTATTTKTMPENAPQTTKDTDGRIIPQTHALFHDPAPLKKHCLQPQQQHQQQQHLQQEHYSHYHHHHYHHHHNNNHRQCKVDKVKEVQPQQYRRDHASEGYKRISSTSGQPNHALTSHLSPPLLLSSSSYSDMDSSRHPHPSILKNTPSGNSASHHYQYGSHPNPLDPSLALPRALPRSVSQNDRALYRDSFLLDYNMGLDSPPSAPSSPLQTATLAQRRSVSLINPFSLDPICSSPIPATTTEAPTLCDSPAPLNPINSPPVTEKKAGRFSRFSFLSRSKPQNKHKRHESVPAPKAEPWCSSSKDRERSRFHTFTYRSSNKMAASASVTASEATGGGLLPPHDLFSHSFHHSTLDRHEQPGQEQSPVQQQQQQTQNLKGNKVKRLLQDIFKSSSQSSSSSSHKGKRASGQMVAREISLPSTYLGQQPESALEGGSGQAKSFYHTRHSLIRSSTVGAPMLTNARPQSPSSPIDRHSQMKTAPKIALYPDYPHSHSHSHHNTIHSHHDYDLQRPTAASLASYMRESLVDPVQQLQHYHQAMSLEQQQLRNSLYYYPDHQQQHQQHQQEHLQALELEHRLQQKQTKEAFLEQPFESRTRSTTAALLEDEAESLYAPFAQASLTPPPASSVLRHSTSSNRIFGLLDGQDDSMSPLSTSPRQSATLSPTDCVKNRKKATRPSSQLIAPVQPADLEGLLRQTTPSIVVAYLKPLLHAAKYPTTAVNGVFLSDNNASVVVDAVPFFHFWNTLTPMLEVAVAQVEHYATANNLKIIGYYEASEKDVQVNLSTVGQKIASKILETNSDAFAVVIKNADISNGQVAFLPYQFKEGHWRASKDAFTEKSTLFTLENASSPAQVARAIETGVYSQLADFDNHLENVQADWLVNKAIA
ncbi:hypothetical protein BGZ94_000728 [Podila epigama]|nr:hypothetical protein BGZ94_000728 [Podila epigama]